MTVNADGTQFTFDGVVVGGIDDYTVIDGVTGDVEHAPMNGPRQFFPAMPDFGQLRLRMYRDTNDAGQQRMEQARANRQRVTGVITLIDGTTRTFPCYVKQLPLMSGSINGVGQVTAVLKVAGPTT